MAAKRLLLVEGDEDRRVIPELIERATDLLWEDARKQRLVDIKSADGVEKLLASGYIATEVKTANLQALGVVVDADEDSATRWQSLRDRCLSFCPDFPKTPEPDGLLVELKSKVRFGVWLMPDNSECGMLETFLLKLRSVETAEPLFQHVHDSVEQSQQRGAAWKNCHKDKVICHTYLAWQDPPGRQLHQALKEKLLDAKAEPGQRFVQWFRSLYAL